MPDRGTTPSLAALPTRRARKGASAPFRRVERAKAHLRRPNHLKFECRSNGWARGVYHRVHIRATGLAYPALRSLPRQVRNANRVRSGRARLRRLLGRARLGAHRFSRICRPDAERSSRRDRCGRGFGLPEKRAASRRELGFVPDHAGRDAIDIGNVRAAKAKRIAAAGLFLLGGVGLTCARQHRNRERRCQHQAEVEISGPDSKHESPEAMLLRSVGE